MMNSGMPPAVAMVTVQGNGAPHLLHTFAKKASTDDKKLRKLAVAIARNLS